MPPDFKLTKPKPKPKPAVAPSAVPTSGPFKDTIATLPVKAHTAPDGPPVPVLQQHGFHGSIDTFNHRVESVSTSYEKTYGVKPTPALVFDLARSPVDHRQFSALFTVPQTENLARTRGVAASVPRPPETANDFFSAAETALKNGTYDEFTKQHGADFFRVLQKNPRLAGRWTRTVTEHRRETGAIPLGRNPGRTQLGMGGPFEQFVGALGLKVFYTSAQFFGSTAVGPAALAVEEGKGVKRSVTERSLTPFAQTQTGLAKGIVEGVKQDVEHPNENLGFLFADIFAAATGGAGVTSRLARGSLRRRVPGTVEVRRGDLVEHELESENPLVAAGQRIVGDARNRNIEKRFNPDMAEPTGLASILKPQAALDLIVDSYPAESKIGRLGLARRRVEKALDDVPRRELEHVAKASTFSMQYNRVLPKRLRRGLTVGENKAIQVVSLDDPDPWQTWRDFHEYMAEAGPTDTIRQAHEGQLAALKLARKAFANPSPRFEQALVLTREIIDRQQQIKIDELGLSPETAEGRVVAPGEVVRSAEQFSGDASRPVSLDGRQNPESFYLPFERKPRSRKVVKDELRLLAAGRPGQFGFAPPKNLPELTHVFTGKSILAGDFRIDATNLASEAYGRTVRLATRLSEHRRLLKGATETPRNADDLAIREIEHPEVSDALREAVSKVDDGELLTADDLAELTSKEADRLNDVLFPALKWQGERVEGVKWVPRNMVMGIDQAPATANRATRAAQMAGQAINEPFRFATLYLYPKYALNALSNVAMAAMQQGFYSVPNLGRGMFSTKLYGHRLTAELDAMSGSGKAASYVNPDIEAKLLAPTRKAADVWNRVVDQWMRRSAILDEIRRRGYKSTKEDLDRFFREAPDELKVEVSRRGKKAMVEFDNLTEFERTYLRNWIFVYPWVSRATVWSLKTLVDHPLKTDILAHIGRDEQDDLDQTIQSFLGKIGLEGKAVDWFSRGGYVPIGTNPDGSPKVINGSQLTPFSTMRDMAYLGEDLAFKNVPYVSLVDNFGPLAKFLTYTATGRDEYGNEFDGPALMRAYVALIGATPQGQAQKRASKTNPPVLPTDAAKRGTLTDKEHAATKRIALSPGWLGGYGLLMTGWLTPRDVDPLALSARWWRDQPLEQRRKHELRMALNVLKMQAELIGQPLPRGVREAVVWADRISSREFDQAKTLGRELSDREKDTVVLDTLPIPAEDKQRLAARADSLRIEDEHRRFRSAVMAKWANGRALAEWDNDVRAVTSFRKPVFDRKVQLLFDEGLVSQRRFHTTAGQLDEYGRKFLAFTRQVRQVKDEIKHGLATTADLRALEDKHDVPVDGLPSFTRMAWIHSTAAERQKALRANTVASWSTLTAFEKTLLGRNTDPKVTVGWAKLHEIVTEQGKLLAREGRPFPRGYKRTLAQYVEKNFNAPGLTADFDFAQQPLFERLKRLKPIQDSPNSAQWSQLFHVAAGYQKYLDSDGGYNKKQVRQMWRDYTSSESFRSWLSGNPEFERELKSYGRTLVGSLIG